MEFKTSDELREFILNRQEYDEELNSKFGPTNQIEWKKDHWIIKIDNKKATEITTKNVPKGFNLRDTNFVFGVMKALRTNSIDGLQDFLKEIK